MIESLGAPARRIQIGAPVVVIAGFTGRDPAAVREHVRELREIGVPEPAEVPAFYAVPDWTLIQPRREIQVPTGRGSGEAEPVLVAMPDGGLYVTVGSDHTDRDLERTSIELAKLAHPKVMGRAAWPLAEVEREWDQLLLRSWVGDGEVGEGDVGEGDLYQEGRLGQLTHPRELLDRIRATLRPPQERPLVAFLGTVPLRHGSFRFDGTFSAAIEDTSRNRRLVCSYAVDPIDTFRLAEAR